MDDRDKKTEIKSTFKNGNLVNFVSLFILYFIQAMPYGFQSRYLPLVMRKQGISITSLGFFKLLLVPWICKFFIAAFVVDVYKSKRFWLLVSLIVLSVGSFVGMLFEDFFQLACILFVLNWASATQDICVDWFAMNALDKQDLGIGNTIQVGAFKLGTLFSGGFLVFLMDYTTVSQTFAMLGIIYMVSLLLLNVSFYKTESSTNATAAVENTSANQDPDSNSLSLKDRIFLIHQSPGTYWICFFVLIYKLGEQSSLNIIPIYFLDRKIQSASIGLWTGMVGQSFSIFGSFLGGILIKKNANKISSLDWLKYCTIIRNIPIILITALVILQEKLLRPEDSITEKFELDNLVYACLVVLIQVQLFLSGILTTVTFTIMMEISFLAPKSIQASHFSLLATCEVFGKLMFQPIVSMFIDYSGYSNAFVLFSCLYLICFFVFNLHPRKLNLTKSS